MENPLMELWSDRFNDYSYNNHMFGQSVMHLLVGQLLRYQSIPKKGQVLDLRINPWAMMDTGSGKSAALDMCYEYAMGLGLNVVSIDDTTDAALIGTIEAQTDYNEFNDKITNYEHVPGLLADADIVHFDEGEILLNNNKNNENMKIYFQKAMNPIGTPSNILKKKLAHGQPIEMPVDASFYVTSYVPEKFESLLMHTGLLPRMLMVPKELTYQDRMNNSNCDIDYLGVEADIMGADPEIMSYLKQIQKYGKQKLEFDFSNVKPLLKSRVAAMYNVALQSSHTVQKLYNGFVPRYQNQMYVLAAHSAVIDDRTNIKKEDIQYAFKEILFPALTGTLTLVELSTNQSREGMQQEKFNLKVCMDEYKKMESAEGWVGRRQLATSFSSALHASVQTGEKHLKTLIDKGHFEQTRSGNTYLVRPVF